MIGICAIVETRIIGGFGDTVRNHVHFSGFEPMVFHSPQNEQYVKEELKDLDNVRYLNIGVNELSAGGYNRLLSSKFMWEKFDCDKVLIFQHDSRLLRYGINEFMAYDMIGANIYHMEGFNGGLSLRSVSKMLEIIERAPYEGVVNEDIWAYQRMKQIGASLPTKAAAQRFSVETVASLGSFGVHAIDRYLCKEMCDTIYNQYKKLKP